MVRKKLMRPGTVPQICFLGTMLGPLVATEKGGWVSVARRA